jgi:hypothetical protein
MLHPRHYQGEFRHRPIPLEKNTGIQLHARKTVKKPAEGTKNNNNDTTAPTPPAFDGAQPEK